MSDRIEKFNDECESTEGPRFLRLTLGALRDRNREGFLRFYGDLRGMLWTPADRELVRQILDEEGAERTFPGIGAQIGLQLGQTQTRVQQVLQSPVAAPPPAPVQAHAPAAREAAEKQYDGRIVLTGGSDTNPFEDGALIEDELETPYGTVHLITGIGVPKDQDKKWLINRDAVGARVKGNVVTIVAADGVGGEDDSDEAARIAVEVLLDIEDLSDGEAAVTKALADAKLKPGAATCVSVVRIRRNPSGKYRLETGQCGDTSWTAFRPGRRIRSLEQNSMRFMQDLEQTLRGMGALRANQRINELPDNFDAGRLSTEDQAVLKHVQKSIAKHGWEKWLRKAPHTVMNYFDGNKERGVMTVQILDGDLNPAHEVPPGTVVWTGTDGVFDNCPVIKVTDEILEEEAQNGEMPIDVMVASVADSAVDIMKDSTRPQSKNDNVGLAGIRLI